MHKWACHINSIIHKHTLQVQHVDGCFQFPLVILQYCLYAVDQTYIKCNDKTQNCEPARNFHSNHCFLKGTHYMKTSYLAKRVERGAPKYKHCPNFAFS